MLYNRKNSQEYDSLAQQVIKYAERSGYEDIKADFTGYDSPASLTMLNQDLTLTPDFSAKRGEKKFYFELALKNEDKEERRTLISKWKALESVAKMKGGDLRLFVPHGSFKYVSELMDKHGIEAKVTKIKKI